MGRWKKTDGVNYLIESDGITVWVNAPDGLIDRFGRAGIDVHQPLKEQSEKGECLYCTHVPVTESDWPIFVAKMLEHHKVVVPNKHMPIRFKKKAEANGSTENQSV